MCYVRQECVDFCLSPSRSVMARNQEKQYGKLNRLWLQKQKDDGHLKDIHHRPRLSTLNSAAEVKKWIPSIKNEIEYYLEQSQLSHYSERKIQEFQERIEKLRKEYQHYLWKLRQLDPSHKGHPWKPRGYTRKRQANEATQACKESEEFGCVKRICTPVLSQDTKKETELSSEEEHYDDEDVKEKHCPRLETNICAAVYNCSSVNPDVQDKPLSFNRQQIPPKYFIPMTSSRASDDTTGNMAEVLLSNLPNLQSLSDRTDVKSPKGLEIEKKQSSDLMRPPSQNILGLECYSSSEDDTDQ